MAFKVKFSKRAIDDLAQVVAYIHADSPSHALRFRQTLQEKVNLLKSMPASFPIAPENQYASQEIRQLLHGQYRILYMVREKTVFLLTIRHGARLNLSCAEVEDLKRER